MVATYFPPVPKWQPDDQPFEAVVDRLRYYSDGKKDLVFFTHGTCVVFAPGHSDADLRLGAESALKEVFTAHPDMNPHEMDDGNMLVAYRAGVSNVVLRSEVDTRRDEIEAHHLDGLAESEVLITPLGPNKFDDRGKWGLFGRCFMFKDAQSPAVVRVVRAVA